jgi:hypothetical protein
MINLEHSFEIFICQSYKIFHFEFFGNQFKMFHHSTQSTIIDSDEMLLDGTYWCKTETPHPFDSLKVVQDFPVEDENIV